MNAPGKPKTTMRLPLKASAAENFAGETGQASPNSVDSVKVASGMRSPILIMRGSLDQFGAHVETPAPTMDAW